MPTDPAGPALATKEEEEAASLASADSREAEDDAPKASTSAPVSEGRDTRARRASATTPASARRSRRKKDDEDKKGEAEKESKPRSRRPREKSTAATPSSSTRKKPKLEHPPEPPRQSTIPDLVTPAPPPDSQSSQTPSHPEPSQRGNHEAIPNHPPTVSTPAPANTFDPPPYPLSQSIPQSGSQSQPPPQPQRSSGQNYDPIRSAFDNPSPAPPLAMTTTPTHTSGLTPSQTPAVPSQSPFSPPAHAMSPGTAFRASASPAISSIIDPPMPTAPVQQQQPPQSIYSQVSKTSPMQKPSAMPSPHTAHTSSGPSSVPISSPNLVQLQQEQQYQQQQPSQHQYQSHQQPQQPSYPASQSQESTLLQQPVTVDIEMSDTVQFAVSKSTAPAKKEKATSTGLPSNAPSPKPSRTSKDAPPPLPQGSGLISGALFGVDGNATTSGSLKTAPNIILHIPLHGQSNKVINFARMAEEQYGFAALHPRLAAQRERLARVAAASAALEKTEKGAKGISAGESAEEDLSVDVEPESDLDADISMEASGVGLTGGNAVGSETGLGMTADGKKKRTRKKKIEDYDRDDPFVDDSELAWQEHAAASKDGFFVYSGPLVPEGEKVQVERYCGFRFCQASQSRCSYANIVTEPMGQSDEVEAAGVVPAGVEARVINSLSRLLYPFPKKQGSRYEDQDPAVVLQPGNLASQRQLVSKWNKKNKSASGWVLQSLTREEAVVATVEAAAPAVEAEGVVQALPLGWLVLLLHQLLRSRLDRLPHFPRDKVSS